MPTTPTLTRTTVADWFAANGVDPDTASKIAAGVPADWLTRPVTVRLLASAETGSQAVYCGGPALFNFRPSDDRTAVSLFLTLDDLAGQEWDSKRRQGLSLHEAGPRPAPRFRLVMGG